MAGEVTTENNNNIDFGDGTTSSGGGVNNFFQDILGDPQKRLYAIIGVSVFAVLIIGIFFFGAKKNPDENKGKLVPLVQEIDQARAFEIVAKLKSVNIEAKVTPSEKPGQYVVQVFENAIETSYLALSRTNLLENDDYGLFDQSDWAASDYDKRIKLLRAINGDLSRIISRLEGLRSAIVRVNIPEEEIFTDAQEEPTATVQIELLNDGDEISKSQVKSIVNLLRGYVPDLKKERISIVDTQGRNYNTFKEEEEGSTDDYIEEVERLNKTIEKRITKYLDVILGSTDYEVSVSASISREKIEQQQTLYSEGAVGSRQANAEQLQSNANAAGGNEYSTNSASGKNYNSTNINETMLPSYEQKNVTYLPGGINDVTVALAVDKSVPTMISLQQLRESVAAIVGPEITAENIKITVIDMHAKDVAAPLIKPGMVQMISNFFKGGIWSVIMKIFTIIAIIVGLLLVAIIALNFLSAAANKNYNPELDPNLSNEFDEVLNESYLSDGGYNDYGESQALEQQEALLREMMNQGGRTDLADPNKQKPEATSYAANTAESKEQMQFENLLNNFQSVASSKPDLLAKKIQMWLDE